VESKTQARFQTGRAWVVWLFFFACLAVYLPLSFSGFFYFVFLIKDPFLSFRAQARNLFAFLLDFD